MPAQFGLFRYLGHPDEHYPTVRSLLDRQFRLIASLGLIPINAPSKYTFI